jgi:hypothetical protein
MQGQGRRFALAVRLRGAYNLKAIADYETGPGSRVSADRAKEVIQTAYRFVERVADLMPANGRGRRAPDT